MYDISSLNNRLKSFNHYLIYIYHFYSFNTPLVLLILPLNTHNVFLPPLPHHHHTTTPPVYLSWLIVVLCRQIILLIHVSQHLLFLYRPFATPNALSSLLVAVVSAAAMVTHTFYKPTQTN
jgi:hypothetical protein